MDSICLIKKPGQPTVSELEMYPQPMQEQPIDYNQKMGYPVVYPPDMPQVFGQRIPLYMIPGNQLPLINFFQG